MPKIIRSSSEGSGSGDEFFDAVEHLEEDYNSNIDGITANKECCRLQPLHESNLEEESLPSQPSLTPKLGMEEKWVSARWFVKDSNPSEDTLDILNSRSRPLLDVDAVQSNSASYEENIDEQINSQHDNTNNDNSETEIKRNDGGDIKTAAAVKPKVPPLNLGVLQSRNRDIRILRDSQPTDEIEQIYSVTTKEMKDVVENEYDDEDLRTLNRLVDKLQAVDLTRQLKEEENATKEEESKIDDAIEQHESIQDDGPEQYLTPQKVIDCSLVTDLACDIKSPLEALYLFCPNTLSYSVKGGSERGWRNSPTRTSSTNEGDIVKGGSARTWRAALSSPTRTSVANEDDIDGEASPPPLSEQEQTENDGRQLDWESDSTDDDSSTSSDKYQMINRDTGCSHDLRDVMKQINEAGSSDALDTQYSILPTKGQLEFERMTSLRGVDSKDSDEKPAIPLAAASFDSGVTEESTPMTPIDRKRIGVKFSKMSTSKMAAIRKGVAGLKSSRQQKLNRKRTASADMLPRNAINVRSSSRQKQSRSFSSERSQEIQADSSFNPMLLIKTVPHAHIGPAWVSSFSPNGRFLATGGEDGNVCIWAVSPKSKAMHPNGVPSQKEESPNETSDSEAAENIEEVQKAPVPPLPFIGTGPELATNLEILSSEPIQRFKDHTADVIDLSWSHTNFLLSASIDSSVRLYHFSKPGCLHLFKHANLVASVAFHPKDDRYFISGGIDKKLRMWDITDGRVKEWAQAPDVITAARFTPDGKYAVAGLFRGQVYFYDVKNGLKYYTQIACRNRSGKHRMGKKVTGISFVRGERDDWLQGEDKSGPDSAPDIQEVSSGSFTEKFSGTGKDMARKVSSVFRNGAARPEALRYTERMLVSTNDSRVRLYGLNDFCLVRKYKGHTNYSMQICARISESGSHIACGSENGQVFIWETLDKNRLKKSNTSMTAHQTHDKTKSSNHFEASKASLPIVTDSVFFPSRSMDEALLSSEKVFPFSLGMDRVYDDMSSAAILTLDYDGTMRVFLRKSCIDNILDAATPRGGTVC